MDPLEWLMMQDHVMPRLNARILDTSHKCVEFGDSGMLSVGSVHGSGFLIVYCNFNCYH